MCPCSATLVISVAVASIVAASGDQSLSWKIGRVDTDCDSTCEEVGALCDESSWPTTFEQWQLIAQQATGLQCAEHRPGTWQYNPAFCTDAGCQGTCFWQGRGQRCSGGAGYNQYPSPIAKRVCPCRRIPHDTLPVYSMIEEREFDGQKQECFDAAAEDADAETSANVDLPLVGSPYTIEAWVQPEEVHEYESFGIVGWGRLGYGQLNGLIFFRGSHSLRNIWWQNDLQAYLEKPLADGSYHHVAATWDGNMRKIFVDFREVASARARGYNVESKSNFCVGSAWHQDGSRATFRGKMKDVKVWNFARTAMDMMANSNGAPQQVIVPGNGEGKHTMEAFTRGLLKPYVIERVTKSSTSEAVYSFDPPANGCYMVEERHPHVEGKTAVPVSVGFCRALQAQGHVDHSDGRHEQWNYLASLPFYVGHSGGVQIPRGLSIPGEPNAHAFRFSHLGHSCHTREAQVHHLELEITASWNPRLRDSALKAELGELLTSEMELSPGRLTVTHVHSSAASASVQLLVRPAGLLFGRRLGAGRLLAARDVVATLVARLQADAAVRPGGLATRLCAAGTGGAGGACAVAARPLGVAAPAVHFGGGGVRGSVAEDATTFVVFITVISVVAVVLALGCCLLGMHLFKLSSRRGAAGADADFAAAKACQPAAKAAVATDECSPKKLDYDQDVLDENASTATPPSLQGSVGEV